MNQYFYIKNENIKMMINNIFDEIIFEYFKVLKNL